MITQSLQIMESKSWELPISVLGSLDVWLLPFRGYKYVTVNNGGTMGEGVNTVLLLRQGQVPTFQAGAKHELLLPQRLGFKVFDITFPVRSVHVSLGDLHSTSQSLRPPVARWVREVLPSFSRRVSKYPLPCSTSLPRIFFVIRLST